MARKPASGNLSPKQRKNVQAVFKNARDIAKLTGDLHRAYDRRHKLITRVFAEVEKNPSRYFHLPPGSKGAAQRVPMTREIAHELHKRYQNVLVPLQISGPGCDDPPVCVNKPGCICIFSVGTLCCYVCLSPDVIHCD